MYIFRFSPVELSSPMTFLLHFGRSMDPAVPKFRPNSDFLFPQMRQFCLFISKMCVIAEYEFRSRTESAND